MPKNGVVPFAFGVPSTIWSNQMIAWIAAKHAVEGKAQIFTQRDIQFTAEQTRNYQLQVTYAEETPGMPPPTLRIARAAIRWALREQIGEIIVVAARPHLWRCMRDMRAAAEEVGAAHISIRAAPEIQEYGDEQWYCPDSLQPRTRNRKNWRSREWKLELMPFFVYKRVAS